MICGSGLLLRDTRDVNWFPNQNRSPVFPNQSGFVNQPGFSNFNNANPQVLGAEIRKEMEADKPQLNRNTGSSSSTSITSNVLANKGANPNLKVGQGLAVAISIKGPMGDATNDTFANTAMFGTNENDFGMAQANAGQASPGRSGTQTGTIIHLTNDNPGSPGFASSFNKANTNIFSSGKGNGSLFGSAGATGDVSGR